MSMQKPWSLYNKEEKLRIDDLKPEHVRIILLSIPTTRMREWYACQEGDLHWAPITAIPEFYEDVRQLKGKNAETAVFSEETKTDTKPIKKVERRPLFEDAAPELLKTDPALVVESAHTKERRSARRYPRHVQFKVQSGAQVFVCETVDVSMAGLALNQDLPAWVPKTFEAELSYSRYKTKVACQRVANDKVKLTQAESWDVIRSWLMNW